ncbi:hypothetical protein FPF71_15980 [Algibacter amylolyticus]|uniref:Uncharacterized protein n=1 Tax=Algibacter amylolyticus TaxID=1608400 RepID=A0A5M7AUZ9_9FLAO|nr:hypothetical protein [Algibacter amylolyticus]KAA5821376.1 hypothetical protein F2B50_15980 [Algibacter amylolyticus]MBB5268244.1 hypothetical protein [Algibacter amylolyticus]TSJ72888.1 hypothetical protein FPF71_15980 [Algibacter amylolyticus]
MQEFFINLKRLGKKKIYTETIQLDFKINDLKDLLVACVSSKIKDYNSKRENNQLLSFLTPSQIQEQSETGKIGFGDIANYNLADEQASIETAIQAYKDGMFLVFINDEEITDLNENISLTPDTNITFLRMTFLTGTYW